MKKMTVNGTEITTNYAPYKAYTLVNGNDLPNYRLMTKKDRESDKAFLERLVSYGYTRIRFAEVSTMIRGYHDVIAYVR